jgi:hypothetical protein
MANTDSADNAKRNTVRRSFREYVAADGTVVTNIADATGARFSLRNDDGKTIAAGWTEHFDDMVANNKPIAFAMWTLGFHTKYGNEANTVFNPPKDQTPGSVQDAIDWINEWRESGEWARERTGPKIDIEKLAEAVVAASTKKELGGLDPEAAKAALMAKYEANPELVKLTMQTTEYGNKYRELTAKRVENKADTLKALLG